MFEMLICQKQGRKMQMSMCRYGSIPNLSEEGLFTCLHAVGAIVHNLPEIL